MQTHGVVLSVLLELLIRTWLLCLWKGALPPVVVVAWPPRGGVRSKKKSWWRGQLKTAHQPTGGATLSPELEKNCSWPHDCKYRGRGQNPD